MSCRCTLIDIISKAMFRVSIKVNGGYNNIPISDDIHIQNSIKCARKCNKTKISCRLLTISARDETGAVRSRLPALPEQLIYKTKRLTADLLCEIATTGDCAGAWCDTRRSLISALQRRQQVCSTETGFRATHSQMGVSYRAPGQDLAKLNRNRIT